MEIKQLSSSDETPQEYIRKLQTKITYLKACTTKLEIEIQRYELRQMNLNGLKEEVRLTEKCIEKELRY